MQDASVARAFGNAELDGEGEMRAAMTWSAGTAVLFLSACATVPTEGDPRVLTELPENVVAIAAPHQDLTTVRIQPEDGCYWYRWVGPVETTYLPLRTTSGQPICARAPEPAQITG